LRRRSEKTRCDESAIKEWRVATVKVCKLLNDDLLDYANVVSSQIWSETVKPYFMGSLYSSSRRETAQRELECLCQKAAELAILFRGSTIEYEWEQDISSLKSADVIPKDHDIIGTMGPKADGADIEIGFIVFGGVVRGDKNTGLLVNGRTRLSKSHVVIDYPLGTDKSK